MALLDKLTLTEDDVRMIIVDYSNAMDAGDWLSALLVTADDAGITISNQRLLEPNRISFFVSGGAAGDEFTVTVKVTKNDTEVYNDTIEFRVVAP